MSQNEPQKDTKPYLPFEETVDKPLVAYAAFDNAGKEVIIKPKNPDHHESSHPLEQHPTVFLNLGKVLNEPDDVGPSTSKNPRALEHQKTGEVKIFKKRDYIQALNLPGNQHGDAIVVVKYDDPSKINDPQNYTLSYRITR